MSATTVSSSGSTNSSQNTTAALRVGARKSKSLGLRSRSCLNSFCAFFARAYGKTFTKKESVVKKSVADTWMLMIHFFTISTCFTLVGINLRGSFIGYKFASTSDDNGEKLVTLALQVCAKTVELIVVASLGLVILDFLHHFLLFDDDGLPLGLSGSKLAFTNIFYLVSPKFCSGVGTLRSKTTKCFAVFLIVSCALLATFVGPASALLLLPDVVSDWHAGSASYFLQDPNYPLWPTNFSSSTVDIDGCAPENFTIDAMYNGFNNHCPWMSSLTLSLVAKSVTFDDSMSPYTRNITVHDYNACRREILYNTMRTTEGIWSATGMSHLTLMSATIYQAWWSATNWASFLAPPTHPARWYFLRYKDMGDIQIPSQLPAAWAKCYVQEDVHFNTSIPIDFPAQPNDGFEPAEDGMYFQLTPTFIQNITGPVSYWLPKPSNLVHSTHDGRDSQNYFPSAALLIQIPSFTPSNQGKVVACSIEARWVSATNRVRDFYHSFAGYESLYPDLPSVTLMNSFGPVPDGTWEVVELDLSWLETMALIDKTTPGLDPISQFISTDSRDMGKYDSASTMSDAYTSNSWDLNRLQLFLSTLTADGMARVNSRPTSLNYDWSAAFNLSDMHNSTVVDEVFQPLFLDTLQIPNKTGQQPTINAFQVKWDLYIVGSVYRADSLAYYLACTVLITAATFALVHTLYRVVWMKWRGDCWSTEVWNGPYEMLTLSLESPETVVKPSNTGAFSRFGTRQSLLKLRVTNTDSSEDNEKEEKVHVLVRNYQYSHLGSVEPMGYHKLEAGKE